MASPAHVITIGLERPMNDSIRAWFREFGYLPPLGLTASQIEVATQPTMEHLLKRMIDSPNQNFILVIHGYEDGSGLYLKLAGNQGRPHTSHVDLQRLMDLDAGGPKMSAADHATMGIGAQAVDRILALRKSVLARKIGCVEFRSCNLGRNKLSLDRFRQFFGARLAGAPDLHTLFGLVPAKVGEHWMKTHTRAHTGPGAWETYNFPHALSKPDLVACFALNDLRKPEYGGHVVAGDAAVLDAWIKKYLKAGASHEKGDLPVHGLWAADRIVPPHNKQEHARRVIAAVVLEPEDLDTPLGGFGTAEGGHRIIFPLSENYARHIVYSR